MIIDCDTCVMRDRACADCVVNVLLSPHPPNRAVEIDDAQRAAFDVLARSGLVPPLRLVVAEPSPGLGADDELPWRAASG